MSAVRLARGFTGRNKVIKFEGCYHGHVDSLLVAAGSGALTQALQVTFLGENEPGIGRITLHNNGRNLIAHLRKNSTYFFQVIVGKNDRFSCEG